MPGGRTHDMLTLVTGIGGLPVLWTVLPDHSLGATFLWFGAHMVSGIAFSPDLDIASQPYQRWGVLRFIWYPYRELINHRAWISHSLVFGPLLRLLYFIGMVWLLSWLLILGLNNVIAVDPTMFLAQLRTSVSQVWFEQRQMVWVFLGGFVTGGAVHTLADWLTETSEPYHASLFKPKLRRKRRKKDDDEWGIW